LELFPARGANQQISLSTFEDAFGKDLKMTRALYWFSVIPVIIFLGIVLWINTGPVVTLSAVLALGAVAMLYFRYEQSNRRRLMDLDPEEAPENYRR